jgi:hypothetical protein
VRNEIWYFLGFLVDPLEHEPEDINIIPEMNRLYAIEILNFSCGPRIMCC